MSPIEIEQAVERHPAVAEAAVIGVHDDLKGQVPVAFVVARPGRAPAQADLARFCRERMPAFQVPVAFVHVDALPRNEAGKLLRSDLPVPEIAGTGLPPPGGGSQVDRPVPVAARQVDLPEAGFEGLERPGEPR